MEIKKIKLLIDELQVIFQNNNIWGLYSQLRNNLNQYSNQRHPNSNIQNFQQSVTNIQTLSTQLVNSLAQVESQIQGLKNYKTYKQLGFDNFFGKHAIENLSSLTKGLDNLSQNKLLELQDLSLKVAQIQQLISPLNFLLSETQDSEIVEEDQITLFFENGANIETLKELSKISQDWNIVFNSFCRLVSETDTTTKIISVERGSVILTIGAIGTVIIAVTKVSNKVLDQILKVYEIKKKTIELKKLKISALDDAISLLDKQSKLNINNEATKLTTELLSEYAWNETDSLYNETSSFVTKAIKIIIKFINLGGKIEPKLLKPAKSDRELIVTHREKIKQYIDAEKEVMKLQDSKEFLQIEDDENKTE